MSARLLEFMNSGSTLDHMSAFVQDSIDTVLEDLKKPGINAAFAVASKVAVVALAIWIEVDPEAGVPKSRLSFGYDADLPESAEKDGYYLDLGDAAFRGELAPALRSLRAGLSSAEFLRLLIGASMPRLTEELNRFEGVAA